MRISNNMMTFNYLNSLNKALQRQSKLQEQLTDGKAIHRPSDDPIKTIRSLRFNTNLTMNQQYVQNVKDAVSWLDSTDSAMSDVGSVLIRAQELAVKAGGINNETSYKAIAAEVDGLINHLVQVGNTQVGDRYIFSGQMDKTQALERKTITIADPDDPSQTIEKDVVIYKGDMNKISMPVQPGAVDPDQDSVNVSADQVFGPVTMVQGSDGTLYPTLDVFSHMIELKQELQKTPPDQQWISNTAIKNLNADHTRMLSTQTVVGERQSQYEMTLNMLNKAETTISADIAANEDIDLARVLIDFKTSENVYNSALAVGARILPRSLVDYLS
ncbi:MAG: flagellar hook-associated protein FlgL [Sporomusaceae bacterium]|nr:flagellar hook-associated protein FlgL [Sporomusaceae bacterium]